MFSKPIQSLCAIRNEVLFFLDLSNNWLSGELPDCWMHLEGLKILKLENNNFLGKIPRSMSLLLGIKTIDLSNNSFSVEIPSSLKNCTKLKFINLGHNNLSGQIPMWLGSNHPNLVIFFLQSNHLFGSIHCKNRCNNIKVIAIVYAKCYNKIWGNKFVLQKNFVAINLKYFNENFDVIIYLLL